MKLSSLSVFCAALGSLFTPVNTVIAQGTAFTYQGRLNDGTDPANGIYDLTFALFDADTAGNQIGSTLTNTAVGVSNGLFVVTLDLGAGIFDGTARWLEIGVSTNEANDFAVLNPRQAVTPTPYAIYAATAASAASLVAGAVASDQLSTLAAPTDGQVLAWTGGSLLWTDPGVAAGSLWTQSGADIYYNAGNVGIGTSTPMSALSVETGTGYYGITHTDGAITIGSYLGSASGVPGGWLGTFSNHPLYFFVNNGQPSVTIDGSGTSMVSGSGFVTVGTPNGESGTSIKRGSNRGDVRFDGTTLKLVAGPGFGPPSSLNGVAVNISGNVGIGTESPQAKLHVLSSTSVSHRIETGGGVNAWARVEFADANGLWNVGTSRGFNGDQFYVQRQGSANIAFAVQPNGDAIVERNLSACTVTIRGGCDLAEPFLMKEEEIAKGSVVVIDDAHPGQLKLSTEAYDTRVAGIVSGANGINPGISLQQEGVLAGGQNVALSGRVYVQADAAFGAIRAGDLLTTSHTPGHAMKVTNHAKAQGAILGKAMSPLDEGKGMVLVLVTLQ